MPCYASTCHGEPASSARLSSQRVPNDHGEHQVLSDFSVHAHIPAFASDELFPGRPVCRIPNSWSNRSKTPSASELARATGSCRPVLGTSSSKRPWLMGGHRSSSQTPSMADFGVAAFEMATKLNPKRQSSHNRPPNTACNYLGVHTDACAVALKCCSFIFCCPDEIDFGRNFGDDDGMRRGSQRREMQNFGGVAWLQCGRGFLLHTRTKKTASRKLGSSVSGVGRSGCG